MYSQGATVCIMLSFNTKSFKSLPLFNFMICSAVVWLTLWCTCQSYFLVLVDSTDVVTNSCEVKAAILDDPGTYSVQFEACSSLDQASECKLNREDIICEQAFCDGIRGVGNITRVWPNDDSCKETIQFPDPPHDNRAFSVSGRLSLVIFVFTCILKSHSLLLTSIDFCS